jgi:hypothetical protein
MANLVLLSTFEQLLQLSAAFYTQVALLQVFIICLSFDLDP